ncbi:MAG: LptF/LptG family permease [Vicinamibacteria bacterium]|nr:LptF/LptG family permease [Vicinamibacteria bacterium]
MRTLRALKPSLLDRYIFSEIVPPSLLGLLLFTFILLLQEIAVLTGFLVSRSTDLATLGRIFLNLLPHILAVTIPMAFLLGLLLAFGRMAAESELIALRAGGVSALRILRPVFALGIIAGMITLYITAVGYPNANQSYRELTYALITGHARTAIKPRIFTDDLLPSGSMMLYATDISSATNEWRDIFIRDQRVPREPKLILARRGRLVIERARKEAWLDLKDGAIYGFSPVEPSVLDSNHFTSRALRLPFNELFPPRATLTKGDRELTFFELCREIAKLRRENAPRKKIAPLETELHKRLAIPAACLVFGLLGLGLSLGSRKEARSAAFSLSIVVIFVYYVFLRLGEQAGDTGQMTPALAMWAANLFFGLLGLILIVLNHREAAFDPLDFKRLTRWLPRVSRRHLVLPAAAAQAAGAVGRRWRMRFLSILDGYIARVFLEYLLLIITAFWTLFLLVEFMDLLDDMQHNKVAWSVLLKYFIFHAPEVLQLVLPVGFLVATLTTLGILSRRNEITAMKAGGISVHRLSFPILMSAALGSLTLYGFGEFVIPYTNRVAAQSYNIIKGRPQQSVRHVEQRWVSGRDGRFYEFMAPEGAPKTLYSLWVYEIDARSWRLQEFMFAGNARWNDQGHWDLERGFRRTLSPRPAFREFSQIRTREIETPDYLRQDKLGSDTLRFGELRDHINKLASVGMDVVRLRVHLHRKLSIPFVAVVMTLLGIPFAFVVGKRGALYGIGISIVLAVVYWSCYKIFEGLGVNALLPPLLAMWAPNLLFGATALYLATTLDT